MTFTGIKCTPEELKVLTEHANTAANTPVICFSVKEGLEGNDWASRAWRGVKEECHACALKHGLPEFEGFYGLTRGGEFVRD
jgi:hypothetical protein